VESSQKSRVVVSADGIRKLAKARAAYFSNPWDNLNFSRQALPQVARQLLLASNFGTILPHLHFQYIISNTATTHITIKERLYG
jgi:hypothetical protein